MLYSTYLLIANHLKTPLQLSNIRLATANNTELLTKGSTLITFKHGVIKYTYTFILVEQSSAAFLIGCDFVISYKAGLYWNGEGKG